MKFSIDWIMDPLHKLIHRGSTPERVAGGFSLGLFIGAFPGIGTHMALAAFFAAVFRLNIVSACMAVWYTNPWTWAPVTYVEYFIGAKILGVEMLKFKAIKEEIVFGSSHLFSDPGVVWQRILLMKPHFKATMLGSIILGALLAAIAYPWLVLLLRRVRRKRQERREAEAQGEGSG